MSAMVLYFWDANDSPRVGVVTEQALDGGLIAKCIVTSSDKPILVSMQTSENRHLATFRVVGSSVERIDQGST